MRAALLAALPCVSGHYSVQYPPSWHDPDGSKFKPGSQCTPGCTGGKAPGQIEKDQGCSCQWYTNFTYIVGKQTIGENSPLRSFTLCFGDENNGPPNAKACEKHPWRAPGTAPIYSPCGHDGGNPTGCPAGTGGMNCARGGYANGPDARTFYKGNTNPVKWAAGSVAEVFWMFVANHGGGTSMRLCKKPAADKMLTDLTEECFQKGVLRYSGDEHWVQTGSDVSTRSPGFPAVRTTNGTFPPGSQWTKNPIPNCAGLAGSLPVSIPCVNQQFEPPLKGSAQYPKLYGSGVIPAFHWSVVDKVEIPADLDAGLYVLSVRFDCEQTPQVWNSCSDVLITK